MAPRRAIPDTAEFTLWYLQDGQTMQNIVHSTFVEPGVDGWNASNLQSVIDSLKSWWTPVKAGRHTTISLTRVDGLDLGTAGGGTRISDTSGLPVAGTLASHAIPNGLTACVTLRSAVAGRSHRGRIYYAGLSQEDQIAPNYNQWSATAMTREVTNTTNLITALSGTHGTLTTYASIVSWTHGYTTKIISCGFADPYVDYQRRRAPGHNRHR